MAISWQFLAVFFCVFCLFFCIFGHFVGYSRQFFAYSSNWQANHIVSTIIYQTVLFLQYIQNANLGILPVYIFIYLCFTPTSLVPVEGIITMIRAIKTDQDFDTEWSPFGSHVALDIRYMTNDSNFRCYASVLGVSMTSIIMFEFFLLLFGILDNISVFWDIHSGFQVRFRAWVPIGEWRKCFKWIFCPFHSNF